MSEPSQPDIDAAAELVIQAYRPDPKLLGVGLALASTEKAALSLADYVYVLAQRARERAEAEERAKPVDDAWLSEMFPGPTESRFYYSWNVGQVPCGCVVTSIRIIVDVLDDEDATYVLEAVTHEAGEEPTWSGGFGVHVQTRGQVLDLLRALGVPTKREEAGR